jgi:hypothetical protein
MANEKRTLDMNQLAVLEEAAGLFSVFGEPSVNFDMIKPADAETDEFLSDYEDLISWVVKFKNKYNKIYGGSYDS